MKKILFIIQYDSFLNTLFPVISQLIQKKIEIDIVLLKSRFYEKNWISSDILLSFNDIKNTVDSFEIFSRRVVFKKIKNNNYETIIIGTTHSKIITTVKSIVKKYKLKSRLVSGYIGALLNNNPNGFIKGLKRRSDSNLIWTPGPDSKDLIINSGIINIKKTKVVDTGLPRLDQLYNIKKDINPLNQNSVVFFEQPTFPKTKLERKCLVNNLIAFANKNPEDNIIIKPRFGVMVGHAHTPKYLLQDILLRIKNKPENIFISNEPIYELFKKCKLAITISSTAGIESLLVNIPTLFITDFCNNINKYGSEDFKKFNATISFDELLKGRLPKITYNDVERTLRCDGKNTSRLTRELVKITK